MKLLLAFTAALMLGACASGRTSPAPSSEGPDPAAFMAEYARDLLAGDREGIVGRYDPRGVYMMGMGQKRLAPPDSVRAIYFGGWTRPAAFEWQDLSYERTGPDAVVVTGRFRWVNEAGAVTPASYTGLLVRQGDDWKIRVEDESFSPRALRDRLCPPDSAARR